MKDINIIIPMGGIGKRFSDKGYFFPKPFIKVKGKPIIFWVIESLQKSGIDKIFIPYNKSLAKFHFEEEISRAFPDLNIQFLKLKNDTKGASETVYRMLENMSLQDLEKPFFTVDGDNFYLCNLFDIIKDSKSNGIVYFKDCQEKPIYSYINIDSEGYLTEIKEKIKISNNANSGIYIFQSGNLFIKYYSKIKNIDGENYISRIYQEMVRGKEIIKCYFMDRDKFVCLGTPEQTMDFSINTKIKQKNRICFDLDNTLVTYPKERGNYETVVPIQKNIDFLNALKREGNYIIIHSARRMKTHNGDISKVKKDIGETTEKQLKKFGINYDELLFGKPYAEIYIDDKAINTFSDLNKETGYYFKNKNECRSFNEITYLGDRVKKTSRNKAIEGEIYYYKNIPENIKMYFPQLRDFGDNYYIIDRINGISFSDLLINHLLTEKDLLELISILEIIHQEEVYEKDINIYANYYMKIIKRYEDIDYSKFEKSDEIFNFLKKKLTQYEQKGFGTPGIIHGDLVFTNILFNKQTDEIKLIDMRGLLGERKTTAGDIFYDYAKIYHSLLGYDFVIKNIDVNDKNLFQLKICFENYILNKYGKDRLKWIKIITLSLFFSLIPLHSDKNRHKFWEIVSALYHHILTEGIIEESKKSLTII